jgi:hypothetical protein
MAEQPRFAGIEFPLRPMIAVSADQLPLNRPDGWAFEPKFDGFRCVAFRSRGRVALQSRQQRPFGRYFPEIVAAVTELATDAVVDGELVVWLHNRRSYVGTNIGGIDETADARVLRPQSDHRRHRAHPGPTDQRGLRPRQPVRRPVPVCHRRLHLLDQAR